ncbi:MAG: hypothetical protein DMG31_15055 [Acidobacteria bacterium]|nr:MAG: hypothetical protein DMG31_15055 [Acidobacteriota bacterium]
MVWPSRLLRSLGIVLLILLGAARVYTKRPWVDEGWFAASAINILQNHHTGIQVADPLENAVLVDQPLPGIDQHFYAWMPMQELLMAGWYWLFGFSIFVMRANALLWGLIALLAWWRVARFLSGDHICAALATLLIGTDYVFINAASDGRMDMMCLALWAAALAVYLELRASRLNAAILLSQSLVVVSCLTHPIGAVGFVCLLVLALNLDLKRLRPFHLGLAALPYLVAVLTVAAYVGSDFGAFWDQFSVGIRKRVGSSGTFLGSEAGEIGRYIGVYFPPYARHGVGALRLAVPLIFVGGILFVLTSATLRRTTKLLVLLTAVAAIGLCVIDPGKLPYYLVDVTPLYCLVLATSLASCFRDSPTRCWAALVVCAVFLVLQISWNVGAVTRDPLHKSFLPMTNFLQKRLTPDSTVTASPELCFVLGFDPKRLRDNALLGYASGRHASFIVISQNAYGTAFEGFRKNRPELAAYVYFILNTRYERIYHSDFYEIYRQGIRP